MNTELVFAVGFDGTLTEESIYPDIGAPNLAMFDACRNAQAQGHRVVLWTCRSGKKLQEAVAFCKAHGLKLDGVNQCLKDSKIYADYYIDDKAMTIRQALAMFGEE